MDSNLQSETNFFENLNRVQTSDIPIIPEKIFEIGLIVSEKWPGQILWKQIRKRNRTKTKRSSVKNGRP